jgi:hypothetical protein
MYSAPDGVHVLHPWLLRPGGGRGPAAQVVLRVAVTTKDRLISLPLFFVVELYAQRLRTFLLSSYVSLHSYERTGRTQDTPARCYAVFPPC